MKIIKSLRFLKDFYFYKIVKILIEYFIIFLKIYKNFN